MATSPTDATTCCGYAIRTSFCPHCGKPNQTPLDELLGHCWSQVHAQRRRLEVAIGRGHNHLVDSLGRTIPKWESWANALTEAMQELRAYRD